jgi:transcriptional regulator GlxA family with amidase domain
VLARCIDAGPRVPAEMSWALAALARGRSAGAVARELGWSDRRLLRTFRRQVGVPPTVYARIVRFRRALGLLGAAPLGDVALTAGYYDQAHMNRDFRAFAGVAPGAYVGSVQDAA